jgi:hypothetical protein
MKHFKGRDSYIIQQVQSIFTGRVYEVYSEIVDITDGVPTPYYMAIWTEDKDRELRRVPVDNTISSWTSIGETS